MTYPFYQESNKDEIQAHLKALAEDNEEIFGQQNSDFPKKFFNLNKYLTSFSFIIRNSAYFLYSSLINLLFLIELKIKKHIWKSLFLSFSLGYLLTFLMKQ